MFLLVLTTVIVVAALWWLNSRRVMSLNERLYLKRRGYATDEQADAGPPVARDVRLLNLIESLGDISPYSRQRAAEDLSRLCAAGHKDPRMLSALIAALDDTDASVRSLVATALGNLGGPLAIEALELRMKVEESIHVRAALAKTLEKLGGSTAGE
jgi:HEAT repeat protein